MREAGQSPGSRAHRDRDRDRDSPACGPIPEPQHLPVPCRSRSGLQGHPAQHPDARLPEARAMV